MYSYIYNGINNYIQGTEKEVLRDSSKKEFNCFEWESIKNKKQGFGLSTKIRMVKIEGKNIIPTTEWNYG